MLIAIEGIDGAGKGTLCRELLGLARGAGIDAATLSFPRYGETRFAELIGQYLNGQMGSLDEVPIKFAALLYGGDRFESRQHLLDLSPADGLLILDRYVASNIAYNAAKLPPGQRPELIAWIERLEFEMFGLPRPDLTLLLATQPQLADQLVARKGERGYTEATRDLHEADRDYLSTVAAVYAELAAADPDHWLIVDPLGESGALRPPEAIAGQVWRDLRPRLDP